jgi:glycosyltransferase involved in cell wall biosynthesis
VRALIDRWVIVDTGSTDSTQEVIRECLHDVPGELHQRLWRNFGHNRTEALRLAEHASDYLLFIDADETLRVPDGFKWPELDYDAYYLTTEYAGTEYARCALVSSRLQWRWVGVLHEYLASTTEARKANLPWPRVVVAHDGARSRDPETYEKDALVLEQALQEEPQNARYAFYLAQSWRDAGRLEKSHAAYLARARMGGWDEEAWYALYQAARLGERLGKEPGVIAQAYLTAFQTRPQRAEPLYHLARFHRERREFALAFMFAQRGAAIARPPDILFVEEDVYAWRLLDEVGTAAYYVGAYSEGRDALRCLLGNADVPESERPRLERNLQFYGSHRATECDPATLRNAKEQIWELREKVGELTME